MKRHETFCRTMIAAALFAAAGAAPAYADGAQFFGTVTGAGVGGLIGNQFGHGGGRVAATTAGVLAGGYIGNRIGHSIDHDGHYYAYGPRSAYYAQPTYVAPAPVYYSTVYVPNYVAPEAPPPPPPIYVDHRSGGYCREYSELVRVGNQIQESYGTACLRPDGTWRIIN